MWCHYARPKVAWNILTSGTTVQSSDLVSSKVLKVASDFMVREISTASIGNASSSALLYRTDRPYSHNLAGEIAVTVPPYHAVRARFPISGGAISEYEEGDDKQHNRWIHFHSVTMYLHVNIIGFELDLVCIPWFCFADEDIVNVSCGWQAEYVLILSSCVAAIRTTELCIYLTGCTWLIY